MMETGLEGLDSPVTVRLYLGGEGERDADRALALLEVMDQVSEPLALEIISLDTGPEAARHRERLDVDHGPVIEVQGQPGTRFWFYGYPQRRELEPLLDGIMTAAGKPVDLPPEAEDFLAGLDRELLIRIFTTPD